MPCSDGGVPYPPTPEELLERKVAAMLCGVLSTMTPEEFDQTLNKVYWKEAGVTEKELRRWWDNHQQRDQERLRKIAWAKLTPAERKALGMKAP